MEIHFVGVGAGISDRFREVAEEKSEKVAVLAPKAQRLDIKVTHHSYHQGRMDDETVEITLDSKGPVIRAEATDADKFTALDLAIGKLSEQMRRVKGKRLEARDSPRGPRFAKGEGLQGLDVQPASVETIRAVATGTVPVVSDEADEEEAYSPVVIREKEFAAEWMSVQDAVDRMELVGHDFFLFIDAKTDQPAVVYRRKGWDYGVIALNAQAEPPIEKAS